MITLNKKILDKGKCGTGGFKATQLDALGEVRSRGWYKRLLGKKVTKEQYKKFLSLRDDTTLAEIKSRKVRRDELTELQKKNRIVAYYQYLKSKSWTYKKMQLFEERGKFCEVCKSEKNIQVHHKNYERLFQERLEDLAVLCSKCHMREHDISI